MPEALIIPFVIAQALPAPMIAESVSLLFDKSRAGLARGVNSLIASTDPRHV